MTTKMQMKRELERCYQFLKARANTRGFIVVTQECLASEFGVGVPKFNRLVNRLKEMGVLRIVGGGRQPKTIAITPVDADGALIREDERPDPSDERTAVALRLFEVVCEVAATRG